MRSPLGALGVVATVALVSCGGPEAPPAAVPHGVPFRPTVPTVAVEPAPAPAVAHADVDFLRRIALTRNFRLGAPKQMTPSPDGKSILFLRSAARDPKQSLFETDLATGTTRELLSPDAVAKGPETLSAAERARRERMRVTSTGFTSFELTKDGTQVLLTLSGRLFVLTRKAGTTTELHTGEGAAIDPHFSPDGKRVAYVRGNDVFAVPVDGGKESPVTRGGTSMRTHGVAEFVAQEELDRSRGFWWSPDAKQIVYEEADVSKVEELRIQDAAHPEKEPERTSYPRAGRTNADVRLGIVSAGGGATTWLDWDRARYPYVATVTWSPGAPLTLYVLDRLQKNALLLCVDAKTGKTRTLVEEHDDAWINVDASVPQWLPDGSAFAWSTERTGASELALHDRDGKRMSTLAAGPVGYDALLDLDAKQKTAVIATKADPTSSQLYLVKFDGGEPVKLVAKGDVVRGVFRPHATTEGAATAFATYEGSAAALPRYFARALGTTTAQPIPSVAEDPGFVPRVELTRVGPDETRVAIVRPRDFDAKRKYPVIDAAYGGPGVTVVEADAFLYLRAQWMADATQAIVVSIDAPGTPGRGRERERAISGKLGSVPLDGHVATLRALGPKYPEMDLERVGIYGWSFGGYLSALAVLARPDVFKVGVAGAPPADWRDYDTCYTERYLGLPSTSAAAYDAASLLTHAKKQQGMTTRPLLVIHGTADDNVYFTHSLALANALERAGRPFELMPLAGVTHLLTEPEITEVVWTRASDFLRKNLADTR